MQSLPGFHSRYRLRRACCRVALTVAALVLLAAVALAYQTEHVMLVIIDGLRYSDGLGDSAHQYVPEMYQLSLEGSIVEPFLNDRYTVTNRAIPAILCGDWSEMHEFKGSGCSGGNYLCTDLPTVFEYYRKQTASPREKSVYILADVGSPWRPSLDEQYGPRYWPLYHSEGTSDLDVWHEARSVMSEHHPSLVVLYLTRVDHFGHTGSWPYYTRAIQVADSIVGMLWDFIEEDPVYSGTTTIFVTNDHGRHTDDFTTHGCDCAGCRTVQLLAVGPDIKRGYVSTTPRTLCDITPTIGELLGFKAEKAVGSVMYELLAEPRPQD
jgi:hypothetical protein